MFGFNKEKKAKKQILSKYNDIKKLEETRNKVVSEYDNKMKKLKEEILNMAKLTLKDGKIVSEDSIKVPTPPIPPQPQPMYQQPPIPPQFQQPQPMYQQPPIPPQFQQPQPMYQQPPMPQPFQEEMMPEEDVYEQPPMPPQFQQFRQQPQARPQPQQQQQTEDYTLIVELIEGRQVTFDVSGHNINQFLKEFYDAIDTQSTFPIGDGRGFNGRYVVFYTINRK